MDANRRRGRFAPTPSGQLHLGNARTALLAWLQMRSVGGEFLLRMEDIDTYRSKPSLAQQILDDLRWLGIDWDTGPDIGGPDAPYTQSERLKLYEAAMRQLFEKDALYPCFCSRADLQQIASAPHGLASEGPAYPGLCRGLTANERAERAARKTPSIRFRMPEEDGIEFEDAFLGWQRFSPSQHGGDFIVRRADEVFGYQLAVVVDDAAMRITDVLRGADLLDSTPRQLQLYEALALPAPRFAHVPLLVGADGQRLSKRHGSTTLAAWRGAGTPPERVVGALAWLSGLIAQPEPLRAAELAREPFRLDAVPAEPAVVDERVFRFLAGER
ncbi:tRNA glutamyl-Q(34) synthetase GluQRS [Paenibacillus koleovorans]|uniref:tRNA glutamyl-Q(34) synthetase GluQRS n=1 Tax=Paenibacillus koleovorans TaxID=121608 RepID=UPI000FD8A681|nr:tRNA glutamyl-Q(34) synthetase GluQRS [Paenibacillus koleovorans]